MSSNVWLWVVLAVVVLIAVVALVVVMRRSAGRKEAVRLRERAQSDDPRINDQESSAKELRDAAALARRDATAAQEEADRAEGRAQALERRSEEAVLAAREERDRQTDTYLSAEKKDPHHKG